MVEASREISATPVVVAVHDSQQALRLFRSALDEAMSRSLDLIVLDYGATPLRDELRAGSDDVDERETRAMRALWTNPHVRVIRDEPVESDIEKTVSFCEAVQASMLILAAEHLGSMAIDARLSNRIFNADFDVLVITDHPRRDRLGP